MRENIANIRRVSRVFINGDQKAELGKAIAVLDEVRKLGIAKVAIETKAK